MSNKTPREQAAFNARPKSKTLPPVRPQHQHGKQRLRWTREDWITKARNAIVRFQPRHLADLLAALRLPCATSRQWAVGARATAIRGVVRKAVKAKPGWLAATADVPRPKNHDLHMLRYLTHPTLDAITARRKVLEASGAHEVEALRQAVDEIVGEARKAGEERRSARRHEKYGDDPVPAHRLEQGERERKMAAIREQRAAFLDKNRSALRKRAASSTATNARLRRKKRAKLKALGGRKGLAAAMLDANRKARWQKAAAEMLGYKSFARVPKKKTPDAPVTK